MLEFGWGGGMEHQTITSIGGYFNWEDGIVHELSHQWWGDNVTCATWADIWVNEGFATYSEALWYENKPGGSEAALHSAMASRRPWDVSGTVYCYDDTNVNRIFDYNLSYLKGGWVLHMLRRPGDTVFRHAAACGPRTRAVPRRPMNCAVSPKASAVMI
jgi:aminopeptidase N